MEDIKTNPDKPWNWRYLSHNPNITIEDIISNPDKPWDWEYISSNPNITMEDIKTNPDKPWNWRYLSHNPNITIEDIISNSDMPWNWSNISSNKFTKSKKDYLTQQYRRHLSAYRIQQHWHRIRSDPRHPVGQRLLELEYAQEFGE